MVGYRRWLGVACLTVLALPKMLNAADEKEAQWIWLQAKSTSVAAGQSAYFRKHINLRTEAAGSIEITADDEYELFVNGRKVGAGNNARDVGQYKHHQKLSDRQKRHRGAGHQSNRQQCRSRCTSQHPSRTKQPVVFIQYRSILEGLWPKCFDLEYVAVQRLAMDQCQVSRQLGR